MTEKEIVSDVDEKVQVLNWMVKKGYDDVDQVGEVVSSYYSDPEDIMKSIRKNLPWEFKV